LDTEIERLLSSEFKPHAIPDPFSGN